MNAPKSPFVGEVCPAGQRIMLWVVAVLASLVSAALTIKLCWNLGHTSADRMLAVCIGIIFELAKASFFVAGFRMLWRGTGLQRWVGLLPCLVSLSLIAASLGASVGYFAKTDARNRQADLVASRQYQDLLRQLDGYDQQVALLSASAMADLEQQRRTRSLQTTAEITKLRALRSDLAVRVATMEHSPALPADPNLGMRLGDPARLRLLVFATLALLLELVGMVAFLLLQHGSAPPVEPLENATVPQVAVTPVRLETPQAVAYETAKQLIVTGKVAPTTRALRQALRVSQEHTMLLLHSLVDAKVLQRRGRRYVMS